MDRKEPWPYLNCNSLSKIWMYVFEKIETSKLHTDASITTPTHTHTETHTENRTKHYCYLLSLSAVKENLIKCTASHALKALHNSLSQNPKGINLIPLKMNEDKLWEFSRLHFKMDTQLPNMYGICCPAAHFVRSTTALVQNYWPKYNILYTSFENISEFRNREQSRSGTIIFSF